jgi:hypothetical protein
VIRDPEVWRQVLVDVGGALAAHGASIMGAMVSPIHGADGNVEFLVHAEAAGSSGGGMAAPPGLAPDDLVQQALALGRS